MKPGITCIWQVSGRNEIDFAKWMKRDLEYIDNWSLWLDVKLVLKTIPTILMATGSGKTSYPFQLKAVLGKKSKRDDPAGIFSKAFIEKWRVGTFIAITFCRQVCETTGL